MVYSRIKWDSLPLGQQPWKLGFMSCLSVSNLLEDCFCCLVLALLEIAVGLGSRRKGIKQSATDHYFAQDFVAEFKSEFLSKDARQNQE